MSSSINSSQNKTTQSEGHKWFRQNEESEFVIQAESESPLENKRLKQIVTANNIVPFARVKAAVA